MRAWKQAARDGRPTHFFARSGLTRVAAIGVIAGGAIAGALVLEGDASSAIRVAATPDLDAAAPRAAAFQPDAALDAALLTRPSARRLTVERGDTLMSLLTGAGVPRAQAHAAIEAMSAVFSPRHLRPGHEIEISLRPALGADPARLIGLSIAESPIRAIVVARAGMEGFAAEAVERPLETRLQRAEGAITSSLYVAAVEAGVPLPILSQLITVFSFDVDFQRDIQPGDRFAAFYEIKTDEAGAVLDTGEILIGEMTVNGQKRRFYRFEEPDGRVDYFDAEGKSVRKALLATPIEGARLSSGYGMRRHPILGYNKMHRGLDFAAPTGTPIFAAGDGVVERANRFGAYGNYVRIRHNATYSTAYAHLSKFGRGVKAGARVRQGQVIGYVGSTGRSTGPHLHYEVLVNGQQANPRALNLPTGRALDGALLQAFLSQVAELDIAWAAANPASQIADAANPRAD